ncbi:MAG: BCCT family transporter [Alphaproteobacteria bacterium]|nr:BCCT family transporter [Alphaproteobacteria bacterium]
MRASSGLLKGLNPTVAIVSKVLVLVFVLFTVLETERASAAFGAVREAIIASVGWLYVAVVAGALGLVLYLMVGRFGSVRLGAPDERPAFGLWSWFSMLFAAGMGIGLVFWSIAEPLLHYTDNPFLAGEDPGDAAEIAMRITFFHWGLHPWAVYALVGLCFAYFGYRRGLPLTVRSALVPVFGERVWGPLGHAVDILAVFATTFGVATSLGLGAVQINTGLAHLFGLSVSVPHQLVIIGVITLIAVTSVVSGLDRGIRLLSEANMWMSVALLLFVASFGPTAYLIETFVQGLGDYLQNIVWKSLWTDANANRDWQASWTTFYWGWWISWAPFVGMFIARISRGRTIRAFCAGVLLAPTLVTLLWLAILGGTALHMVIGGDTALLAEAGEDVTLSLYSTIEALSPGALGTAMAALATVLIATFFVTSSDSGTLVVNTILSVGNLTPPVSHRLIWGVGEGAVAGTLLLAGGLSALQSAAISAALPFAVIMVLMAVGLLRALHRDFPHRAL